MGICIGKVIIRRKVIETMVPTSQNIEIAPRFQDQDIQELYKFETVMGQGKFGTVYKARNKLNPSLTVAIKSIIKERQKLTPEIISKEIEILKTIDHPNIIKFYDYFESATHIYIVMEYCDGGELFQRIVQSGKISEKEASGYIMKILGALNYLHSLGICHRDLKPQNFLFENNCQDAEVKLIDFGLSNRFNTGNQMKSVVGTPHFIAPEVLAGQYDDKCDIWSLGVSMYSLLTGDYPFTAPTPAELYKKLCSSTLEINLAPMRDLTHNAVDLIKKMLIKNPGFRIDTKEALNHPWFDHLFPSSLKFPVEIIELIRHYTPPSYLYKILMGFIIKHLSFFNEKKFRNIFFDIDVKHLGYISFKDLKHLILINDVSISDKQLYRFFTDLSVDAKDIIYYSEFLIAIIYHQGVLDHNTLVWAFKIFETDEIITFDTLKSMLERLGKSTDELQLQKCIKKLTSNSLNIITFEDFKKIFSNTS
jgi:calcium-dependent protein kinase